MTQWLWDASGLAKRYASEIGSDIVDMLWAAVAKSCMATTFTGYAETYSILLRKRNRGDISKPTFALAGGLLRAEIINDLEFSLLAVETVDVLASIELMDRHNINSTDAALLATFLRYTQNVGEVGILVAADLRLLRAGAAEGLKTLNPESVTTQELTLLLSAR